MRSIIIIILVFFFIIESKAQDCRTIYHLYQPTESVSRIVKWNIEDTTNQRFLVKEIIDKENRVISIQYLMDGKVVDQNTMYGITNLSYEYGDNFIVENYFDSQGNPMTFLENESPTKRIYFLNDRNEIVDCKTIHRIEFVGLEKEKLLEIENSLKFWRENVLQDTENKECEMDYIYGYMSSYMKMNGIFPKKADYKFDFNNFELMFSEEIIKELNIKYNP